MSTVQEQAVEMLRHAAERENGFALIADAHAKNHTQERHNVALAAEHHRWEKLYRGAANALEATLEERCAQTHVKYGRCVLAKTHDGKCKLRHT